MEARLGGCRRELLKLSDKRPRYLSKGLTYDNVTEATRPLAVTRDETWTHIPHRQKPPPWGAVWNLSASWAGKRRPHGLFLFGGSPLVALDRSFTCNPIPPFDSPAFLTTKAVKLPYTLHYTSNSVDSGKYASQEIKARVGDQKISALPVGPTRVACFAEINASGHFSPMDLALLNICERIPPQCSISTGSPTSTHARSCPMTNATAA